MKKRSLSTKKGRRQAAALRRKHGGTGTLRHAHGWRKTGYKKKGRR